VPIILGSTNQADYFDDEQTGRPESDLVGNAGHPAAYFNFDNANTPSLTDGTLAFRVRVGSDLPQLGTFDSVLFIGMDGNSDGALDIFLGADNKGGTPEIKIWDAGTGLNISPSTTSVSAPPGQFSYGETSANFDFSQVSATIDPPATIFDLDVDGTTDRFVSFSLPFADVVSEMSRLAGIGISENSVVRFVIATSTQANSLNEDLNGIPKNFTPTLTWAQLGGLSSPTQLPEPGTGLLAGLGLAAFACFDRFRRQARR